MATAILNPMFESISGRIGNVVFYRRGNRQCVRTYVVPNNPDTVLQGEVRRNFASAVRSWQKMTPDERYAYTRKARRMNMSGYNLFISFFITGGLIRESKYNAVFNSGSFFRRNKHHSHGRYYCHGRYCRFHSVSMPFLLPDSIKTYINAPDTG